MARAEESDSLARRVFSLTIAGIAVQIFAMILLTWWVR